jgi:hypothetical protein
MWCINNMDVVAYMLQLPTTIHTKVCILAIGGVMWLLTARWMLRACAAACNASFTPRLIIPFDPILIFRLLLADWFLVLHVSYLRHYRFTKRLYRRKRGGLNLFCRYHAIIRCLVRPTYGISAPWLKALTQKGVLYGGELSGVVFDLQNWPLAMLRPVSVTAWVTFIAPAIGLLAVYTENLIMIPSQVDCAHDKLCTTPGMAEARVNNPQLHQQFNDLAHARSKLHTAPQTYFINYVFSPNLDYTASCKAIENIVVLSQESGVRFEQVSDPTSGWKGNILDEIIKAHQYDIIVQLDPSGSGAGKS